MADKKEMQVRYGGAGETVNIAGVGEIPRNEWVTWTPQLR